MPGKIKIIAVRAVIALVALIVLAYIVVLATFQFSKRSYVADLEAASQLSESDYGVTEYALEGDGPIIMVLHGTPGGFDQAPIIYKPLIDAGFSMLAVSRAGYLRSTLTPDLTLAQEADALESLLDDLEIKQVAVIGSSGGGALAFKFAELHSDRIWAFVPHAAIAKARSDVWKPRPSGFMDLIFGDSFGEWLSLIILSRDPEKLLYPGAPEGYKTIVSNPEKLKPFLEMLHSGMGYPLGRRRPGWEHDLSIFPSVNFDAVGNISAPTLFVYGADDDQTPYQDAEALVTAIGGAELYLHPGDHFAMLANPDDVFPRMVEFFRENAPTPYGATAPEQDSDTPETESH